MIICRGDLLHKMSRGSLDIVVCGGLWAYRAPNIFYFFVLLFIFIGIDLKEVNEDIKKAIKAYRERRI